MVTELAMSMFSDASRMKVKGVLNGMMAEQASNWINEALNETDSRFISILDL